MAKMQTTRRRRLPRPTLEGQASSFWRSRTETARRAIVMVFVSDLRQVKAESRRRRMLGQLRHLHPELGERVEQALAR
jgi:catalase